MENLKNVDPETKSNIIKGGCIVLIAGGTLYVSYNYYQRISCNKLIRKKQDQLSKKKNDLYNKLVELKKPFDSMDIITNLTLQELISGIESEIYKPIDILQAYQAKALVMDKELNFIVDLNPNVELDCAASLSVVKKASLKGIPISIKDMLQVKDCDCTHGMPGLCLNPVSEDSSIVRSLRMHGAVPFVITNMCQSGKSIESSNPIFGQTLNPHNKERTSGGSSGGEGAILGCGASPIGLGSDIGGSIRIPASYCGIFGLKPTSQRFSHRNTVPLFHNQNLIVFSIGPMARRFDDLLILFKAMACGDLYHIDPYCPPLCFNEKIFLKSRPLRIGHYVHLGESQVTPIPAVKRAVDLAKKALEMSGHVLVPFDIPNPDEAVFKLYLQCLFNDGGEGFLNALMKNNKVDPSLSVLVNILRLPNCLKKLLSYVIYPFNKNYSNVLDSMRGVTSTYNLWDLKDRLEAYRDKVLTKWQSEKLDGLICPVMPIAAPPCQTSQYITDVIGYTAIYNVLDYAAGSVPVTKVTQSDIDNMLASYPKDTLTHRRIIELQKESYGMPVGVQCVTLPWREEVCLRIMRDVSEQL